MRAAHGGGHSIEAIDDLDDEARDEVKELLEDLSEEPFGESIGD